MPVRVLLVDDHAEARATLAERLRRDDDIDLLGAVAGIEEAARILSSARPEIVLLDIQGHDGRGLDVCRRLHELTDAVVVVLTSYLTPELWAAAQEAGAAAYLLKHVDTRRLSREIARLARARRSAGPPGPQHG